MYARPFTHDNVNNTISRMPLIAGRSLDVIPEICMRKLLYYTTCIIARWCFNALGVVFLRDSCPEHL